MRNSGNKSWGKLCDDLDEGCDCESLRSHLRKTGDTWARSNGFIPCVHTVNMNDMGGNFITTSDLAWAESYATYKLSKFRHCPARGFEQGDLTNHQYERALMVLDSPVVILTGGPGTGKSHTIGRLASHFSKMGKVMLLAPTGVAAKRLAESTGLPTSTAHRALQFDGQGFGSPQFDCDFCIIDELSMMEMYPFAKVLQALPEKCHLILVGDYKQLPSVGMGNVAQDLCDVLPVAELIDTVRYSEKGDVSEGAQAIMSRDVDSLRIWDGSGIAEVTRTYKAFIKKGSVFCCALKNSDVDDINRRLHAENRGAFPVMCIANNMDAYVFNGETGKSDGETVWWDDGRVMHYWGDWDDNGCCSARMGYRYPVQLRLSYCSTFHKSQGRTVDGVICHVPEGSILDRTLLYTGETRARREYIFTGSKKYIKLSLEREHVRRLTFLAHSIKGRVEIPRLDMEVRC